MLPDDDDAEQTEAGYDDLDDSDPVSGKRVKRTTSNETQLLVAEFRRRAVGLEGAELQAEFDRLIDRMIERHAAVVPEALRAGFRELIYGMLQSDPTLGAMVSDLRAAVERERGER